MDEDDRLAAGAHGLLETHVHLVHRDRAGGCIGRQQREMVGLHVPAADEEAALARDAQRPRVVTVAATRCGTPRNRQHHKNPREK
jgi:hypothetical protein